jgi:nucleotide-binding universal stress UspA family protein
MKILLAVDGSPFTKKMLAYLTTHVELFGTHNEFTLFTVMAPLPPRARAAVGADMAQSYYDDESNKVTDPIVTYLSHHQITPQVQHHVGHPGELIAKAAQDGKFDLLVMGSHGHSALGNLVMGSVATQVLAHCKVPVLLVR